jgi:3-hydroxyisobutyrate dehydrogenase-like beta-hydroxyacid dehydrogenase
MGLPMALNLKKNGFEVTGYDVNKDAIKVAQEAGIYVAESIAETAQDKHFIVTSLPTTKHVEDTLTKDGGIFKSAAKGTIICDVSTINPHSSIKFAAEAQK